MPQSKPKPGDTVTLSISPVVQLAPYTHAKPFASITREIGDDPDADLEDMQNILRVNIRHSMLLEIESLDEFTAALEGGRESLADYCLAYINGENDGTQGQGRPVKTKGRRRKKRS